MKSDEHVLFLKEPYCVILEENVENDWYYNVGDLVIINPAFNHFVSRNYDYLSVDSDSHSLNAYAHIHKKVHKDYWERSGKGIGLVTKTNWTSKHIAFSPTVVRHCHDVFREVGLSTYLKRLHHVNHLRSYDGQSWVLLESRYFSPKHLKTILREVVHNENIAGTYHVAVKKSARVHYYSQYRNGIDEYPYFVFLKDHVHVDNTLYFKCEYYANNLPIKKNYDMMRKLSPLRRFRPLPKWLSLSSKK